MSWWKIHGILLKDEDTKVVQDIIKNSEDDVLVIYVTGIGHLFKQCPLIKCNNPNWQKPIWYTSAVLL